LFEVIFDSVVAKIEVKIKRESFALAHYL